MKQIFKWLREEIEANSVTVGGSDIIGSHMARVLVNQAEAKWEKECCEWKHYKSDIYSVRSECGAYLPKVNEGSSFRFCPYCGKKIKIAEVE